MPHAAMSNLNNRMRSAANKRAFKAENSEVARVVWITLWGLELVAAIAWVIGISAEGTSWEVQLPITTGVFVDNPPNDNLTWKAHFVGYLPTTSITLATWSFLIIMDAIVIFTWPLKESIETVVGFLAKRRWFGHFFADWPAVVVIAATQGITDRPVFVLLGASVLPSAYLGYQIAANNAKNDRPGDKSNTRFFSWSVQGVMVVSGALLWIAMAIQYFVHEEFETYMQVIYVLLTLFGIQYLLFLIPGFSRLMCCHHKCGLNDADLRIEMTHHVVFLLVRWGVAFSILLAAFEQGANGSVEISADTPSV